MAVDCNTSLSNWLKSIEDPNLWSEKPYNENDLPLNMERPIVEIDISKPLESLNMDEFAKILEDVKNNINDGIRQGIREAFKPP